MNRSTKSRVPKLGRHASGQAVVRLCGKDRYLGRFGTSDAQAQYDTLIAEWLSRGRTLPPVENAELSVNELVLAYLRQHVELHYRKNNRPTSEQHCIKAAVRFPVPGMIFRVRPITNRGACGHFNQSHKTFVFCRVAAA